MREWIKLNRVAMATLIGGVAGLAVSLASCGLDEYNPPTFTESSVPTISIESVSDSDDGLFTAADNYLNAQSFRVAIDAEGTLFPDCSIEDVELTISNSIIFDLTHVAGESTFTVAPISENESSMSYSATVTAALSNSYGGATATLSISQAAADIPYFSTQPQDVTYSSSVMYGSSATTSFVIYPSHVTDVTEANFTVTQSEYFETSIVSTNGSSYGYTVTFTATMAAIDALSSIEEDLEIPCTITFTYDETESLVSESFNVIMAD